jgi:2-polyprenyl-6-methoxyphenol hydroxylase-like FAD-dependent oxidoreductase
MPKDILIAGAGPTGLTAAIELARRGYRPRIVSANAGPVHESRALAVNRRTMHILAASGATKRLLKIGLRPRGMRFHTAARELFHAPIPQPSGGLPFVIIVPQSHIETVLVETLAGYGISVEWQTRLEDLQDRDAPKVGLIGPGGEESCAPDILIGADGAHSVVRHKLGIDFPGSAYETEWGLADVRVTTKLSLDELHVFDLAPILFVMLPIKGDLVRFISDRSDVLTHVPPPFEVASVEWESAFRISHRQAKTYQSGNVFLAGDAAHIHSPVGGRGMNLGIEDAAWLAWLIAEGKTAQYTTDRWPVARRVLRTVDPATRLMAADSAPLKFVRRHILPWVMMHNALRSRVIARIAGTDTPEPPWLGEA